MIQLISTLLTACSPLEIVKPSAEAKTKMQFEHGRQESLLLTGEGGSLKTREKSSPYFIHTGLRQFCKGTF